MPLPSQLQSVSSAVCSLAPAMQSKRCLQTEVQGDHRTHLICFPSLKDHSLALFSNIWKELLLIFCPVLWLLCWEVNFRSCYSLMAGSLNQRPKSKGSKQSTGARTLPSKSLDLFQQLWRLRALTRTKTLSHSLSSTNLSEVAWVIPISHETEA